MSHTEEHSDIQVWNLPWAVETNQASFRQNIFTTRQSSALFLYLKCKHRCKRTLLTKRNCTFAVRTKLLYFPKAYPNHITQQLSLQRLSPLKNTEGSNNIHMVTLASDASCPYKVIDLEN